MDIDFEFQHTTTQINRPELEVMLHSRGGDVGKDLWKRGHRLAALAAADVGKDTGRLAGSIGVRWLPGPEAAVIVGSELDYAYYVHEGTHPHEVIATPGRILRFNIRGRVVYAQQIHHPGTDAQKYLSRHLRKVL